MNRIQQEVVAYLESVPAAFVTEVVAAIRRPVEEIDAAMAGLERGCVIVVSHPSPDAHVTADLRIAVRITDDVKTALANADAHWQKWLRSFVQSHRCS